MANMNMEVTMWFSTRQSFLAAVLLLVLGLSGLYHIVIAWAQTPGEIAAIDQVRADLREADRTEAAGIVARASRLNESIAWHQALRSRGLTAWSVSRRWDAVEPIRLRRGICADPAPAPAAPKGIVAPGPTGYVPDQRATEAFIRSLQRPGQTGAKPP